MEHRKQERQAPKLNRAQARAFGKWLKTPAGKRAVAKAKAQKEREAEMKEAVRQATVQNENRALGFGITQTMDTNAAAHAAGDNDATEAR